MTDADPGADPSLFTKGAGARLREAREAQGLSLAEIAARTRVPIRHLEAIEQGDYAGLPSSTYAVGFAKAYARAVGVDEVAIGREVRGTGDGPRPATPAPPLHRLNYETRDPTRLPPRGLATALALVAAILLGGIAIWYGTNWFRGDGTAVVAVPAPEPGAAPRQAAPPPAPRPTGGQVTLAATDVVWLRIYDASGKTLYEHELQPGERYDVPPDANNPMINIGRPDKLAITVNGSAVPPLGDGKRAIKDVPISAAALLARATAPAATATPSAPAARPTPTADTAAPPAFRPAPDDGQGNILP